MLPRLDAAGGALFALSYDPVAVLRPFAEKHGLGYAPKGILRGTVAIPFRDEQGNLLGYIGITEAKLPADFTPNVVSLDKKRA